jgi:hypothetical protein
MKKTSLIATALVVGAGASQAQALDLKGSDTLEAFTQCLVGDRATLGSVACPPAIAAFNYIGTGSTNGESALAAHLAAPATNLQEVAPMSRPLRCTRLGGGDLASANSNADGALIGLDGVVQVYGRYQGITTSVNPQLTMAYSAAEAAGLPGGYVYNSGTDAPLPPPYATNYGVASDILRVLYFGRTNTTAGAAPSDCNSALRQALASNAEEIFEGGAGPTGQLRHLFRRDDSSGTTDVFKTLTGVGGAFCNGSSTQDNDPIRRPCGASEDVCQANGSLGLVLPIAVPADTVNSPYGPGAVPTPVDPAVSSTPANCAVPTGARCGTGVFAYAAYPGFGNCPDGITRASGQCRVPRAAGSTGLTGGWQCINTANNRPGGFVTTFDARVYNLVSRSNASGVPVVNSSSAFYRIHETRAFHGCGCKDSDATQQIGCLVTASDNAIGYAGREAAESGNNFAAQLAAYSATSATPNAGLLASDATIRDVLTAPTYPFARKLYFNSVRGFAGACSPLTPGDGAAPCFNSAGSEWNDLATRVLNNTLVDQIAAAVNFVPDIRTASVAIEEQRGPAGGGNVCQP